MHNHFKKVTLSMFLKVLDMPQHLVCREFNAPFWKQEQLSVCNFYAGGYKTDCVQILS